MALPKDCSATATPRLLLFSAIGLLALRVGLSTVAWLGHAGAPAGAAEGVHWRNAACLAALPPKSADKLVLYEFYAGWSDPCRSMEKTALRNRQVKSLIAEHFLAVRVSDQSRESGGNPPWLADLEKQHRIFALPTLLVVDENGKQIAAQIGACSSLSTYRFLTRALHKDRLSRATAIRPVEHRATGSAVVD